MSIIQQQQQQPVYHHHSYGEALPNQNSSHHLDLSPFIDTNSTKIFPSTAELPTPPSPPVSISNVYQPSDIVALLEPSTDDVSTNTKSSENIIHNPLTSTISHVQSSSCSSAAVTADLLSSLFNSFEPFNKLFPSDDQTTTSSTTASRYNHHILPSSPLLTTAPDHSHYPIYYGHNNSWH